MQVQCPSGHAVGPAARFCPVCGAALARQPTGPGNAAAAPSTCPNGHRVDPSCSFCPQCGAGLGRSRLGADAAGAPAPRPYAPAPPPPGYAPLAPTGPAPQYVYVTQPPMSGLAIASLVVSLVWVYSLNAIVALVLGIVALKQIKEQGQRGRGLAIAGVVIASVELFFTALVVIVIVVAVTAGSRS